MPGKTLFDGPSNGDEPTYAAAAALREFSSTGLTRPVLAMLFVRQKSWGSYHAHEKRRTRRLRSCACRDRDGFRYRLPIAPARASDVPMSISTQQTFNGKTYGFCFSGISAKAGNNPVKTITASCTGSFQTSTSVLERRPAHHKLLRADHRDLPQRQDRHDQAGECRRALFLVPRPRRSGNIHSIAVQQPLRRQQQHSRCRCSAWFPMGGVGDLGNAIKGAFPAGF